LSCPAALDTVSTMLVEVPGGSLVVHRLSGDDDCPRTVLAAHGITANGLSLAALGRALPDGIRLLAPDLRGRAESRGITGPWGIGAHADDLIAVADAVGADSFTVLGHSMGAFVAAAVADRHPERVDRAVLVDGGVAFPMPAGADVDAALTAVIGPAMTRLSMTFPTPEEFVDFMAQNPALGTALAGGGQPADDLLGYLAHDLVQDGDRWRSSCVLEAIRVDGGAILLEPQVTTAVTRLTRPATLLYAARGMFDQTPGLYTAEALAGAGLPKTVAVQPVPDCNHYSILFAPAALRAVVAAVG
jgi:pimeloyl-ACP methyl ester carboxylesterase